MSDTLEAGAEVAEGLDTPANGEEGAQSGAQTESAEDKARRQGWRPAEEFKGPKDKWVDADEFLARGEKYAPFIQAENKKLEKALDAQRAKTADLEVQLKKLGEFASKSAINAYNNAKRDIEADIETAAAAGDVDGVKLATKALVDLGKEAEADVVGKGPDLEWKTAEEKWKTENPWFDGSEPGNRAMTIFAQTVDRELAQTHPNMAPAQALAEVAKRVKAEFPEKFTNPNRERPGAVEAPGGKRPTGRTLADLPPEARAQALKWDKQGVIKTADYLKSYQWDAK